MNGRISAGAALLLLALSAPANIASQSAAAALPPRLSDYLTRHVKLTPEERAAMTRGEPVTRLLAADPASEVAILGVVWINAPVASYLARVRDIEQFEKGPNFLVTKRISTPPRLEDFDRLTIPDDDLEDLRTCKAGSCELKIGDEILALAQQKTDWTKPTARADVQRAIRALALSYVNGYLEGGNERLAVYRDSKRPTFIAREFAAMIERMPELTEYLPDLERYLLDFPRVTLPKAESLLYWQEAKFGLKPTIRINHLTIAEQPSHALVVSKMLYASHYFWTALELRVLLPDPARGQGFWFASVNRSRSDGLSGFVGTLIRGKVRSEAESGMRAVLTSTKTALEAH